ncbi:DUF2523 domain-containing protein [Luteimonas sp. RC10]|uniref:DUF2523 domain-containing protein n=1 Tax=Luteimonas sp. RC10 TaxID=2587035 RepID=UPI00161A7665|nr:DUF2523 domain-containing protein [Luteimonas sp. RC10]MBB3344513.1 hypothetical protein [Luteimonas sp. RC10]
MAGILLKIMQWALGGLIARALFGAGMTFVSYVAFFPLVNMALDQINNALAGMASDMYRVLMLGGLGDVLSILGSAMLTRVSMMAGLAGLARIADAQQGNT